jgi:poly-gamma-glutamate capsule biosynthesis protein CapA/YwtB (metallophosphatase superfamily)
MRRNNAWKSSAVAGAVLLAAACSSGDGKSAAEGETPPQTKAPSSAKPSAPAKRPITLAFGGDVAFEGIVGSRLANPRTALGPIARTLRAADFSMLNLETAITSGGGTPAPGKEFHFRAPATAFTALKAAGVDVASMANNHGMDYMEGGLRDTLAAVKRTRYPVVGIGRNAAEAYRPYKVTVKGNRLAVIGATQVLDDHLITAWTATDTKGGLASAKIESRMVQAVRQARQDADAVIVYLHWGEELSTCPLPRQQSLAKRLVAAGADVVVGGHAHVLQGGGFMKDRYVHYGLGNFVFYSAHDATANSGVLVLTMQGRKILKAQWKPARLVSGLPRLLTGSAAAAELRRWTGLRTCTGLTARP